MLIREVILENFMSYEYARVSLKEGVNVVCGPNGSGKSSFLVGVCVALGDTYTERSKKLSDLIRWGQERARVSLLLDNSEKEDGRRPILRFDSDVIRLTRNLRRDGKYWFEINQKSAQKYEVVDILKGLGFDHGNLRPQSQNQSSPSSQRDVSPFLVAQKTTMGQQISEKLILVGNPFHVRADSRLPLACGAQ